MDNLNKEILRLSLPAIVSNITVPLLGFCDTGISGHLGSELFLAAIAVGTVMLNVVFWLFGFLRSGTTGLSAIAFGEKNDKESMKVLYRGLFISFFAGILLVASQKPLFYLLSKLAGCDSDIENFVRSYFYIRIWGCPASLATMAINGWFIGMQTTFYPMQISIGTNLLNIFVSFLFVFTLGYGFEGVATGTLIADWTGMMGAAACVAWFRKGKPCFFKIKDLLHGELRKYFSVNGNLFLRSFFIICVTMGVTAAGAQLGNLTLAANVIIMQLFQFFSFFMDGFAFSGEALSGRYLGASDFSMLKKTVKRLLHWTFGMGLLFSLLYSFGAVPVASLLTDTSQVVNKVSDLLPLVAIIPIVSCWAFIFDGFYVGITFTGRMMLSTFCATVSFFIIVFLLPGFCKYSLISFGDKFIWIGFLTYLGVRGLILGSLWPSTFKILSRRQNLP